MNVFFWIVMGATVGVAVMLAVFKWGSVVGRKAEAIRQAELSAWRNDIEKAKLRIKSGVDKL